MQKLRGTGTTFSTSGKAWFAPRINPKVAARNARIRRLMAAGIVKPLSKAELRELATQAASGALPRAKRTP